MSILDMNSYQIDKITKNAKIQILKDEFDKIKNDNDNIFMHINRFFRTVYKIDSNLNYELDFIELLLYAYKHNYIIKDQLTCNELTLRRLPEKCDKTDLYNKIQSGYLLFFNIDRILLIHRNEFKSKIINICEKCLILYDQI
jgi:hypothetical protein